jgi:hypothetical protein
VIPSRDGDAGDEVGEFRAIYADRERWRVGDGRLLLLEVASLRTLS